MIDDDSLDPFSAALALAWQASRDQRRMGA